MLQHFAPICLNLTLPFPATLTCGRMSTCTTSSIYTIGAGEWILKWTHRRQPIRITPGSRRRYSWGRLRLVTLLRGRKYGATAPLLLILRGLPLVLRHNLPSICLINLLYRLLRLRMVLLLLTSGEHTPTPLRLKMHLTLIMSLWILVWYKLLGHLIGREEPDGVHGL